MIEKYGARSSQLSMPDPCNLLRTSRETGSWALVRYFRKIGPCWSSAVPTFKIRAQKMTYSEELSSHHDKGDLFLKNVNGKKKKFIPTIHV